MKAVWVLRVIKHSFASRCFREGYFPRKFVYKKDALALAKSLNNSGAETIVEPWRDPTKH